MAFLNLLVLSLVSLGSVAAADKRGLVFTPNATYPADNQIWVQKGSDLHWYYNYGSRPSAAFADQSQQNFEFIPMMWGVGNDPNETNWLDDVKDVMSSGVKITHAMGFNEPDGRYDWGGSDIPPAKAAQAWVANFEPLAKMGVKLGLPACTGSPDGLNWTKQFLANCSQIVSHGGPKKNCTWDFLPVHWYDNFGGLQSHINERRANFPGAEIWVTEFAYAHQDLSASIDFYTQSTEWLESQSFVGRYSYFGAFRSQNANVGPNAAFLNTAGKLTDIGSKYLGFGPTGVNPQSKGSKIKSQRGVSPTAAGAAAAAGVFLAQLL